MKIYISNLGGHITEIFLKTLFDKFGEVLSVNIGKDRLTGESKGVGLIEMANDNAGQHAVNTLNQLIVEGRKLELSVVRIKKTINTQFARTGNPRNN